MKKKVLVTGANGLLGSAIKKIVEQTNISDSYVFFDRFLLDITNRNQAIGIIKAVKPDYVINCAAYTNVNIAENNENEAYSINVDGADIIAYATWLVGGKMIHISTDYVFDGEKNESYTVIDKTNPINYYGETKRNGEISALCYPNTIIIRTSWLYSDTHDCFFTKVLRKIKNGEEMEVVNDEFGQPTNAYDLAEFIVKTINNGGFDDKNGIFHYSNYGKTSWFNFAKKIEEFYNNTVSEKTSLIKPCSMDEYDSPVKRPKNSTLDLLLTEYVFGIRMKLWETSLSSYFVKNKQ